MVALVDLEACELPRSIMNVEIEKQVTQVVVGELCTLVSVSNSDFPVTAFVTPKTNFTKSYVEELSDNYLKQSLRHSQVIVRIVLRFWAHRSDHLRGG